MKNMNLSNFIPGRKIASLKVWPFNVTAVWR